MSAMDERFRLVIDDTLVAAPCLCIIAVTYSSTKDAAKSIAKAHDAFVARYGKGLTFYQLNDSTTQKKVDAKALAQVPFWMGDATSLKQPMLGIELHSGPKGQLTPPSFEFFQDQSNKKQPTGIIHVTLPPEAGDDLAALRPVLEELLAAYPVQWGFVAYSWLWETGGDYEREFAEFMRPLLLRHPGIALGDSMEYVARGRMGPFMVGWLELLGGELLETLGGIDALREAAPKGIEIHPLGKQAAIIAAGPKAELGDVNRGQRLPNYRAVGRLLEPVRATSDGLDELWIEGLEPEEMQPWLRRFFED